MTATQNSLVKPELPEPFPADVPYWKCPKTGLLVPKRVEENLAWRARLLAAAEEDEGLQQDLYTACTQSILFWINAFVFTYRIHDTDAAGRARQALNSHVPMVTWMNIQDPHILAIEDAINEGYSLLTDKTRDMAASWNHIVTLHHQWLFRPDSLFLEMSRVETDVDGADNPRALFVKHDYINRWLPDWMLPNIDRTSMHIVNLDNGSRIDGESSNKAAGSGDRRRAVLLDEFAKMENASKIKAATADVSPCRLANSTPWGPGTAYSQWMQSGQVKVFRLPWWEHPEKGRGRYVVQDETGKHQIRSPWYDAEAAKRSPKEMAQEIDMDHVSSGDTFFEAHIVEEHKRMFGRPPISRRQIDFKKTVTTDSIAGILERKQLEALNTVGGNGPLHLWVALSKGRLDQTKDYVLGIDISKGQGASNSVISVRCVETREKVAEWADANTTPHDFARIACAIALWVGGRSHGRLPLMVWEANGPGWEFGREVVLKYGYPNYYRDKQTGTVSEKTTKKYGWHSSPEKKEVALGAYRAALAHGGIINHSIAALDEALTYIRYSSGGIGPANLVEESEAARKTHGDRVIADMLTEVGAGGSGRASKAEAPAPPGMSPAGRLRARQQAQQDIADRRRFDFRN